MRAVLATPAQAVEVELKVPFKVDWAMPSGYRMTEDLGVDTKQIWVLVNGQGHLRKWFYGQGYAWSGPIPESYLLDHLIVLPEP